MLISRSPYRISLIGGGTDYPDYFNNYGGSTVNFSINKHSYVFLSDLPHHYNFNHKIRYFYTEEVKSILSIKHPSIKASFTKYLNIKDRLDVTHFGDLPSASGIGSSSAFLSSLILCLKSYKKRKINKKIICDEIIDIERNILKEFGGYQDQIITTYGGFLYTKYFNKNNYKIKKINPSKNIEKIVTENLSLIYIGYTKQNKLNKKFNIHKSVKYLNEIQILTNNLYKRIINDSLNLSYLSEIIDDSSSIKKKYDISTYIKIVEKEIKNLKELGADSIKSIGQGDGGYLLVSSNKSVKKKLSKIYNKDLINFKIDYKGSELIFKSFQKNG